MNVEHCLSHLSGLSIFLHTESVCPNTSGFRRLHIGALAFNDILSQCDNVWLY